MTNIKKQSIQERIKSLEEQKDKLIKARKEEIAETVLKAGGVGIDNRLLAGFTAYASMPENKDSEILKQMQEVGKNLKLPCRKE